MTTSSETTYRAKSNCQKVLKGIKMEIYNGKYTVYIHINKINGKMYIGLTCQNTKSRFGYKGYGYKHCSKFWNAIQKYGWDNFDHEIFASNLTKEEACNMEKILIEKLDTINHGYNIDAGGFACKHSPESIEKIRNKNIGKIVSEETKEKIRQARKKQEISHESIMKSADKNRGKKRTDEFKERSRECKIKFMKKVFCVETKETYESISQASRETGINKASISGACYHNRIAGNFHWQFVNA